MKLRSTLLLSLVCLVLFPATWASSSPSLLPDVVYCLRSVAKDGHWYANFGHYIFDEHEKVYSADGGSLNIFHPKTGTHTTLLSDSIGSFRDPEVDFDARKILFSYRKGGDDYFHLYEINIDGTNLRQLTSGPYNDIEPCYLPDGKILFVSTRCNRWVNCWITPVANLHRCDAEGKNIEMVSANIEHDNTPALLPDGQVIYTRWEYIDRSQVDFHHLWQMSPDGTRQTVFFGNQNDSLPGACLLIDARPIPGTDDVMAVFSSGHGHQEHRGVPVIISNNEGPDRKSNLRFVFDRSGAWMYDPFPLSAGEFLFSEGDTLMLGHTGRRTWTPLFAVASSDKSRKRRIMEPRPIAARQRPPHLSEQHDSAKSTGEMILMNVYEGRNMEQVAVGEVKHLLVLEVMPKPANFTGGNEPLSYSGTFSLERIAGIVPVEDDGSAYLSLPKDRSVFFVALDSKMQSVQRMQSFTSVRGGETVSCIGCHEHRTLTPDHRMTPPIVQALRRKPSIPQPVKGVPELIDFPRDVQPILDRHCLSCHGSDTRKGGIDLTGADGPVYSLSYFSLVGGLYVSDGADYWYTLQPARSLGDSGSKLITLLEAGHHDIKLTADEMQLLRFWINTGAPYPGTYGALGSGMVSGTFARRTSWGGYDNQKDNRILDDPRTVRADQEISRSCVSCHAEMETNITKEDKLLWWRSRAELAAGNYTLDQYRVRSRYSRHRLYNLTHPAQSALLLAPLSKEAGGLGLCEAGSGKPVLKSKQDKRYGTLLQGVEAGKEMLDRETRFSMKNFVPNPSYTRQLKTYGVLPPDHPDHQPYDVYAADRAYWRCLWDQK